MSAKCNAKTTAGKPCRAAAVKRGLCSLHADPQIAVEMGRKSGQARRTRRGLSCLRRGMLKKFESHWGSLFLMCAQSVLIRRWLGYLARWRMCF